MRGALWLAVNFVACGGGGDLRTFEGQAAAQVEVVGRPDLSRTRSEPAEQVKALLRDGRIEVRLDECTFTTEPAVGGQATIAPGTRCTADKAAADVQITVQSGEVALDQGAGTLSVQLEGDGRASRLGESLDVRYRYSFTGTARR